MDDASLLFHRDRLYGYAMFLSRNPTDAADLVQETYTRALRAIENLHPDSNIKNWLFTILRNIWLNQLRQKRSTPALLDIDADENYTNVLVETSEDPHALYVSKIEHEQVRQAIQQLSLVFREIIMLREYEDLSYQEISNLLGCPIGTVMSRLGRARAKLRDMLTTTLKVPMRTSERPK